MITDEQILEAVNESGGLKKTYYANNDGTTEPVTIFSFGQLRAYTDMIEKMCVPDDLIDAVREMAEDGWLYHGVEGFSPAQEKCHAAYLKYCERSKR